MLKAKTCGLLRRVADLVRTGDVTNLAGEAPRGESVGGNVQNAHGKELRAARGATASPEQSPNEARAPQLSGPRAEAGPAGSDVAGRRQQPIENEKIENRRGRAPVELVLVWLVRDLERQRERYEGMRVDALAAGAAADAPEGARKMNRFDRPEIRDAKAKERARVYSQVINGLNWLLGERRPWMKVLRRLEATGENALRQSERAQGEQSTTHQNQNNEPKPGLDERADGWLEDRGV